jgi:hypothetical protein
VGLFNTEELKGKDARDVEEEQDDGESEDLDVEGQAMNFAAAISQVQKVGEQREGGH